METVSGSKKESVSFTKCIVNIEVHVIIILIGAWLLSFQFSLTSVFLTCASILGLVLFYLFIQDELRNKTFYFINIVLCLFFVLLSTYVPEGAVMYTNGGNRFSKGGFYSPFVHEKPTRNVERSSKVLAIKKQLPEGWYVRIEYTAPKEDLSVEDSVKIIQLFEEGVEIPITLLDATSEYTKVKLEEWFKENYQYSRLIVDMEYRKKW